LQISSATAASRGRFRRRSCGGRRRGRQHATFKGWSATCHAAQHTKSPFPWQALGIAGLTLLNGLQLGADPVTELAELAELGDLTVYLMLSEDIVRTLSVSFAEKLAAPEFLRLFRSPPYLEDPLRPATSELPQEHLRWIIGNGLGIFAGPSLAEELIELALDRRFGHARYQIVSALPKIKDERVAEVLMSLLDDPTVRAAAIDALGKMKFMSARTSIEALLADPDKNVRDQAKKALKRMGN
jgi:hypothetical protein